MSSANSLGYIADQAIVAQNVEALGSKGSGVAAMAQDSLGTGAQTLTVAQIRGGAIVSDPEGSATWTTPSAQELLDAGLAVGDTLQCVIYNNATAASAEVVTIAGGTGVTVLADVATLTEGTNNSCLAVFVVTAGGSSAAANCILVHGLA